MNPTPWSGGGSLQSVSTCGIKAHLLQARNGSEIVSAGVQDLHLICVVAVPSLMGMMTGLPCPLYSARCECGKGATDVPKAPPTSPPGFA